MSQLTASSNASRRTELDERIRPRHSRHDIAPVRIVVALDLLNEAGVDLLEVEERQALGEAAIRERQVAHALLDQVAAAQLRASAIDTKHQHMVEETSYWNVYGPDSTLHLVAERLSRRFMICLACKSRQNDLKSLIRYQ